MHAIPRVIAIAGLFLVAGSWVVAPDPAPAEGVSSHQAEEMSWDEASAAPAYGTYMWPVRGPVIRAFEEPSGPYGPGHRGIDIAVPFGTPVRASGAGIVAFAGSVAGSLFVSIDHPDGIRTTYSWLSSISVGRGDVVARGDVIGATGGGHPGSAQPHLHFGARVGTTYIDPMLLLGRGSLVGLVHLAPLED